MNLPAYMGVKATAACSACPSCGTCGLCIFCGELDYAVAASLAVSAVALVNINT